MEVSVSLTVRLKFHSGLFSSDSSCLQMVEAEARKAMTQKEGNGEQGKMWPPLFLHTRTIHNSTDPPPTMIDHSTLLHSRWTANHFSAQAPVGPKSSLGLGWLTNYSKLSPAAPNHPPIMRPTRDRCLNTLRRCPLRWPSTSCTAQSTPVRRSSSWHCG